MPSRRPGLWKIEKPGGRDRRKKKVKSPFAETPRPSQIWGVPTLRGEPTNKRKGNRSAVIWRTETNPLIDARSVGPIGINLYFTGLYPNPWKAC